MRKHTKKLRLNRETLRSLDRGQLRIAFAAEECTIPCIVESDCCDTNNCVPGHTANQCHHHTDLC